MYLLPEIVKIINDYDINIIESHKIRLDPILKIIKKSHSNKLIIFVCFRCKTKYCDYIYTEHYTRWCKMCRMWTNSLHTFYAAIL